MYRSKLCGMGLLVSLCAIGCTAAQPRAGWLPKNKQEMEQLIGSTVMSAIDQYKRMMAGGTAPPIDEKMLVKPDAL